jgi:hypothetical protein
VFSCTDLYFRFRCVFSADELALLPPSSRSEAFLHANLAAEIGHRTNTPLQTATHNTRIHTPLKRAFPAKCRPTAGESGCDLGNLLTG